MDGNLKKGDIVVVLLKSIEGHPKRRKRRNTAVSRAASRRNSLKMAGTSLQKSRRLSRKLHSCVSKDIERHVRGILKESTEGGEENRGYPSEGAQMSCTVSEQENEGIDEQHEEDEEGDIDDDAISPSVSVKQVYARY